MVKHSIVLVPFPFDDFSTSKIRPALCLTTEVGEFNHVIIAFISSRIPESLNESDLLLKKGSKAWKNTGLTVDSVIRLHKLVSIPKKLIKRRLGSIDAATQKAVSQKLRLLFEKD
jgi:mRNA interferase MazF